MERTSWNYWKITLLYGIMITAWFLSAACSRWLNHAVFSFPSFSIDDRTDGFLTSTEYRFPEKFQTTLSKYSQFCEIYEEGESIAIPGLMNTSFGESYSMNMVPQGICLAGDYMLITAYDSEKEANSVIYVLSNHETFKRQYLTTIVLPDKNHVGGIAFDGENIWIAKSTSGYCSRIAIQRIDEAVLSFEESYKLENYDENIYCGVTASFVTCDKGKLWIGTYRSGITGNGILSCYEPVVTEEGTELLLEDRMDIPAHAQGVSFFEEGGNIYMILSTSYGRFRDSKIYLYQVVGEEDGMTLQTQKIYKFPPMTEEVVSDGTHTYVLFESAATCYSTENYRKCAYPVDRICALSNEKLVQ